MKGLPTTTDQTEVQTTFDNELKLAQEAGEKDLDLIYSLAWFASKISWDTVKPIFVYLNKARGMSGGRNSEKQLLRMLSVWRVNKEAAGGAPAAL